LPRVYDVREIAAPHLVGLTDTLGTTSEQAGLTDDHLSDTCGDLGLQIAVFHLVDVKKDWAPVDVASSSDPARVFQTDGLSPMHAVGLRREIVPPRSVFPDGIGVKRREHV
jgi:hypothetical protein